MARDETLRMMGRGKKFLFLALYAGWFSRAAFESLRMKPFLQFLPPPLGWAMGYAACDPRNRCIPHDADVLDSATI